jgi:hypothetical protein
MRTNDVHDEPRGFAKFGNGAPGCYKPTVNESETITEAQPLCLVRRASGANEPRAGGLTVPAAPHLERS